MQCTQFLECRSLHFNTPNLHKQKLRVTNNTRINLILPIKILVKA